MTAAVRPGKDVHLFILDDEGLLYADTAQEIYALNTTATYVWCQLEEGASPAEITAAMAATFGFADDDAERHVSDILGQWRTLGLLQGSGSLKPEIAVSPPAEAGDGLPPFAPAPAADSRHYSLLNCRFKVRYAEPAQADWVHPAIAHLAVTPGAPDCRIDLVATSDRQLIYLDEAPFHACRDHDQLAPIVKGLIWQLSLRSADYFLNIHAGVVSDTQTCTLLPAAPGSGKSSLTAALCRAGFNYFSDEVALLTESTFQVVPVPLSMCFKREGWDLMLPYYPELAGLKAHRRGDGKVVRYLSPPADLRPPSDAAQPVRRVIFPRYAAGVETALEPIGRVAALQRMMDECLAIPAPLNRQRVREMVDWISGIDCYALPMSSLDDAVDLIRALDQLILDARTLSQGATVEADICIVGAGAAGITIARELAGTRHRVVVLESGGFEFAAETQALYAGEVVDDRYDPLDATRLRYFGGSTNHWEGNCRPFDAIDFEPRTWVPYSGWPFRRDELVPYYRRAEAICETGPFDYDDSRWPGAGDDAPLAFDPQRVETGVYRRGPPTRFGQKYRDELMRAENVAVYLQANVVEIEVDAAAKQVTGLRLATLNGTTFRVTGRRYVMACGAVENARLLLLSDRVQRGGLGNGNDLVGRYFTDHRLLASSRLAPSNPDLSVRAYDTGRRAYGILTLPADVQRREELLNLTVVLQAVGRRSAGVAALRSITDAVGRGDLPDDLGAHVANVASDIDGVGRTLFRKLFGGRPPVGFLNFHTRVEPAPNPDNRVTLGDARDRLGLRQVRLDWRLGEAELRSIRRAHELIGLEAGRAGIGRVQVDVSDETWLSRSITSGHHIGTLRMHDDPKQGVVDADCRVHGIENLYVAGSAVFPTAACSNPTLTLVALALRTADRLKRSEL